jgi:hypothetical protein
MRLSPFKTCLELSVVESVFRENSGEDKFELRYVESWFIRPLTVFVILCYFGPNNK